MCKKIIFNKRFLRCGHTEPESRLEQEHVEPCDPPRKIERGKDFILDLRCTECDAARGKRVKILGRWV